MTDRELLQAAAKAAGIDSLGWSEYWGGLHYYKGREPSYWNPLTDDGDALRLAVKLQLTVDPYRDEIVTLNPDATVVISERGAGPYAATRRAIVRAAAAIGEGMK